MSINSLFSSLRPLASAPSARPRSLSPFPPVEPVLERKRSARRSLIIAACVTTCVLALTRTHVAHEIPHTAFGKASPRTVESGKVERWQEGTISVVLDGSLADIDPNAQDAVVAAFGTWMASGASVNQVAINRTSERGAIAQDGVNRVLFGPIKIPGHEKDVAVTMSYADSQTGVIREADTIFNSAYAFGVLTTSEEGDDGAKCGKRYDVQNIATHEFGHFFGLGEDISDTTTTMFIRSAPCQTHKRALAESDRNAMDSLYSSSRATDPANPSSCAMSPASSSNPESPAVLFLFAAALAFMIRRGNGTRTCRAPSSCSRHA